MDALAAEGVRYNNFHVTPLCSPTRASLLTGRNHHSVGMAFLANADSGFPGSRGHVTKQAATVAEILKAAGYNTMCVGKWHLAPIDQTSAAGPYDQWPLGRGFERYYGFLDALTDHFYPDLVYDNHRVDPPKTPEEGYHLTDDLIDHAIGFVRDQVSAAGEKPFFTYIAFGSAHCPHQAPQAFLDKYRGAYDEGWDVIRERRYQRQLELGVIPAGTELAPRNAGVEPWDSLSADEQRVAARLQEAFAAMVDHTDHALGRFVDYLKSIGKYENTIFLVMADNGASQEGGAGGSTNIVAYENGHQPDLAFNLARLDTIGGPRSQTNYPHGWAQVGNTPLRRYKQNTHAGGVRAPLIVTWPAGLAARGEVRPQFHHVIDIAPTILDLAKVGAPQVHKGIAAIADPRHQPALFVRGRRGALAPPDAVLRDVLAPRDLARRLEGDHVPPARQHLRPGSVGALQRRRGFLGVPRPGRAAPRSPEEAGRALVGRGRQVRRAAARRPRLSRARGEVPEPRLAAAAHAPHALPGHEPASRAAPRR